MRLKNLPKVIQLKNSNLAYITPNPFQFTNPKEDLSEFGILLDLGMNKEGLKLIRFSSWRPGKVTLLKNILEEVIV